MYSKEDRERILADLGASGLTDAAFSRLSLIHIFRGGLDRHFEGCGGCVRHHASSPKILAIFLFA